MTTPTLRQLDIFAQMVASGSIDACAEALGVPRSAVQQDMAALEQRLGHRLFEMQGGEARLTEAGRTTVAAMQRLAETQMATWGEAEAPVPVAAIPVAEPIVEAEPERVPPPVVAAAPTRQQVVIAAHPAIFGHFQDALDAFEQTNGDVAITLDLDTHTAAQAGPLLARGRADIAYYYALGDEGIESRYAWSEPLALYVGIAHPLGQADLVTPEALGATRPVALPAGNSLRRLIDRALAQAGIDADDPLIETDNLYDIMTAVRDGQGWFAAFGPLARDFARVDGIRRMPLAIALPAIDVRQAVRAAMRDDPVVASLSEYLFR